MSRHSHGLKELQDHIWLTAQKTGYSLLYLQSLDMGNFWPQNLSLPSVWGLVSQPSCWSSPICHRWLWWCLSPADLFQQITVAMCILSKSSTIFTILSKTFLNCRCPCGRIPLTECWSQRTQTIYYMGRTADQE